jgi:SAM-dependent methyltransferase
VDAKEWNDRYADTSLLWSAAPNRWVAAELADVPVGRALDLGAGEGRNALWLAARGFTVTAVDFAKVALDRGRQQAEAAHIPAERIAWVEADLIDYHPAPLAFDVVVIAYLQLPEQPRRIVTARAVEALAPGGVLLVIGHDLANLTYGTGGPQQAEVLFQPQDVVADIRATDRPLRIVRADTVRRPVDGSDRDAIDALVRAQTLSS